MEDGLHPGSSVSVTAELAVLRAGSCGEIRKQLEVQTEELVSATVVASRYETLRLLVAFAQEHKLARLQDRQTLAEALEQLDSHYMTQHTALRNGLDTLAWLTDEELLRVQQEMVYMQASEGFDSSGFRNRKRSFSPYRRGALHETARAIRCVVGGISVHCQCFKSCSKLRCFRGEVARSGTAAGIAITRCTGSRWPLKGIRSVTAGMQPERMKWIARREDPGAVPIQSLHLGQGVAASGSRLGDLIDPGGEG